MRSRSPRIGDWPGRVRAYLAWQGHRLAALLLDGLLGHAFAYRLLGSLRVLRIDCVFLSYPSTRRAARGLFFPRLLERHRWRPGLVGIYRQGGGWGLRFSVTSCEEELCDPANAAELRGLLEEVERIQGLVRAPRRALAGVLPGVLYGRGESRETGEAKTAAHCLALAIHEVQRRAALPPGAPIVLLGARGFVGRRLVECLDAERVVQLDLAEGDAGRLPSELRGEPALLVNLTRPKVLDAYADQMWPGLVVLNEVYPPPSSAAIERMGELGTSVYHLSGVRGWALPGFRGAYASAIPCCAARIVDDMEVQLLRLGAPRR